MSKHNTPITQGVTEIVKNFFTSLQKQIGGNMTSLQKQIGGNMLAEKIVELEMNDSLESLREGGIESGSGVNIIYTMQPKRLFFSGLLKSGKAKSVNGFSSEESKKFLFRKLFNLWSHLKNNQAKNFISELRSPTFISAIRSWNHSLESGVVS